MRALFFFSVTFTIWGFFSYLHAETTGLQIDATLKFLLAGVCYGSGCIVQAIDRLRRAAKLDDVEDSQTPDNVGNE